MSTRSTGRNRGRSAGTDYKDEHMPALARKILSASYNVVSKPGRWYPAYPRLVVFDLTAGFGVEDDGRESIIVRVLDWACEEGMAVEAHLCEQDRRRFDRLTGAMAMRFDHAADDFSVSGYHGDCTDLAPRLVSDLAERVRDEHVRPCDVHGLILVDPCGFVPWDAVRTISHAYARLDLLLNVGAATIKWFRPSLGVPTLDEEIEMLGKTTRLISRPRENWQWVFLLLSNFTGYGRSVVHGLEPIDRSPGREWYEQAKNTRAEIKVRYQPGLWPELHVEGDDGTA